ncbi:unnamed protein product, partial [Echinostoma caproni]|uniref:Uncharacterized protein n=1 Tax=Echinostoma caproni TaxID=27848 RepID=A0A183B273_9TREM
MFNSAWKRYRLNRLRSRDQSNSESTQSTEGFSQFTQSSAAGSIECGRAVSSSLFSKSVTLLLALSDSLRSTPLDEFGLTADTDFGSTATGKVNRERAHVLLGLYDACLEFELKAPLESSGAGGTQTPANDWTRVRQLFARRVQLRNLVYGKLPPVTGGSTGHGSLLLVPVTLHDRSVRPGLLVMGLISAADQARLPQLLRSSFHADEAGPVAHHLLITIAARLSHFGQSTRGRTPYAYRDQLVQTLVPILQHVIRYYNHKLSSPYAEPPGPNTTRSTNGSDTSNTDVEARIRVGASVSAAALSVLDNAFTLALEQLGTGRLHRLISLLYPVVCQPQYRNPLPGPDDEVGDELISTGESLEDSESNHSISDVSPAQALSSLIKLIKGWITNLLNSGCNAAVSGPPKPVHHVMAATLTRDLVILLPLLVRLCRARAQIGSDEAGTTVPMTANPLAGLDRVLA